MVVTIPAALITNPDPTCPAPPHPTIAPKLLMPVTCGPVIPGVLMGANVNDSPRNGKPLLNSRNENSPVLMKWRIILPSLEHKLDRMTIGAEERGIEAHSDVHGWGQQV